MTPIRLTAAVVIDLGSSIPFNDKVEGQVVFSLGSAPDGDQSVPVIRFIDQRPETVAAVKALRAAYVPSIEAMNAATGIRTALNRRADVEICQRADGPSGTFDIILTPASGPLAGALIQRTEKPSRIEVEAAGEWGCDYSSRNDREHHTLMLGQPHRPVRVSSSSFASRFGQMCQLQAPDLVELGYIETTV